MHFREGDNLVTIQKSFCVSTSSTSVIKLTLLYEIADAIAEENDDNNNNDDDGDDACWLLENRLSVLF